MFRSQVQAELLNWLYLHPDEQFGVSDLAARLRVPLSTLHREIVRLHESGLITSATLGRNRLVQADLTHPASRPLAELLEITFGPRLIVAEEFSIPGASSVIIFGSWAARFRGASGPPPGDVNVMVIGDVDRADVSEAADRAQGRLGLEVNPVVRSRQQWIDASDPLVSQIQGSSYVEVIEEGGDDATLAARR
ncbi:MarR family transcriptional regulator [Ornithinimicrobium sp. F0845]|uniref:MarR family transcriptional regulator n=1 Tax=Ornithinimicrobium sp. F0845 TaxID=2926412 RepID=UPI001FF2C421|nr:MarR family transcriptional regulator [Ornithinimicrobium sp. F0845]MCK0114022.1 MarR family transcriptional regulator [Ornithinimicrobium sp. F0845]